MNKHMTKAEAETASINAAYQMDRVRASERVFDEDSLAAARADFEADTAGAFADAVSEVLEQQKEPATDRGIFERGIANRRAEKARQQAIAAAANAKIRALTVSIRAMEDSLDGLLVSEA